MSSTLKDKTYSFSIDVVRVYRKIVDDKKEYVLSKQILRSGTAIGALIAEAAYGQSKPDFISKLSIALKEANETKYWLCLLKDTQLFDEITFDNLSPKLDEILKMLVASIKTAKGIPRDNLT